MPETSSDPNEALARLPLAGKMSAVDGIALWMAGAAVGWLTGLSVSPVLATVLASALGLLAGVVTTVRSLRRARNRPHAIMRLPLAIPAAILMLGIAIGAPVGIIARTYRWFEPTRSPAQEQRVAPARTSDAPAPKTETPEARAAQDQGVLFGVDERECSELVLLLERGNVATLRTDLRSSPNPDLREIERRISNPNELATAVKAICSRAAP